MTQINAETAQLSWQAKSTMRTIQNKLKQQFGFIIDPTLSLCNNSSNILASTPTWYYFSHPSNFTFHDFTKQHKPQKNLHSLQGLGLKFIPIPTLTNSWMCLKNKSYNWLFRSVHLRLHFAGKPPNEGTTEYGPKIYVCSTWTPPHWIIPPDAMEE